MDDNVFEQLKQKAEVSEAIGGTLKFKIGDLIIYVDGTGSNNVISQKDDEADCVVSATPETLANLKSGKLKPMTAVMMGKIKIGGDMGLAMKVKSLLGG